MIGKTDFLDAISTTSTVDISSSATTSAINPISGYFITCPPKSEDHNVLPGLCLEYYHGHFERAFRRIDYVENHFHTTL